MARVLAIFLLFAASAAAVQACYSRCRFHFCSGQSTMNLGGRADVPFTGAICDRWGNHIGVIGNSGEAHFVWTTHNGRVYFTPISRWSPNALKQRFSPSFFKTYTLRKAHYRYNNHGRLVRYYKYLPYSGVGRETFQQNQKSFLNNKCIILPLRAWQVLNSKKHVVENVHMPYNPTTNCVAFRTRVY